MLLALISQPGGGDEGSASQLSVPGPLALLDKGRLLAVACERSGEIKMIDPGNGRIIIEKKLGDRITGMAPVPGTERLVVAVGGPDELMLLDAGRTIEIIAKRSLSSLPGSLAVSPDGRLISLALPAERRIARIRITDTDFKELSGILFDFTPGLQRFLTDGKLVVADEYGGALAMVGAGEDGEVTETTETPFHNISGLTSALTGERILVSHQRSSSLAEGSFDDLHWGSLMRNEISSLSSDRLTDVDRTLELGDVGEATGDPAGIVLGSDWRIFVALAGVNEIGIITPGQAKLLRIPVGNRPRELLLDEPGRRLYAANSLADSISVINIDLGKVIREIRVAPEASPTARDRGERLFFDARQSHDAWMSCHSCHTNGHSNGRLIDTLGDGSFGNPKRVLSLLGVRDTAPHAWNGSAPDLRSQVSKSLETTMHRSNPMDGESLDDLVVFLESLDPPAPVSVTDENRASVDRGRDLFVNGLRCHQCHDPNLAYTTPRIYDVGVLDETGSPKFNPPSLRGVGSRGRLFHDQRAESLEKVFTDLRHGLENQTIARNQLTDLLAFLRSL